MTADGEPFGDSEELAEPYQWQVGDEIECRGVTRRLVELVHGGWVTLQGVESPMSQPDWERRGWKLHREAATISDSVGADVEGQS
jgi:hypothetical protein